MMRATAGYYPLSAMFPHVVAAGSVLSCAVCGSKAHAPIPNLNPTGYGASCEAWLLQHRNCAAESTRDRP